METKYTPESISKNAELQFSIPLYQRLFEWEKEQIEQLLNDLKSAYEKDATKPYYIGMLTSYQNTNNKDLVDGQQRFTVLMLLGICLEWDNFLKVGDKLRLTFFARSNDEKYLKQKIAGTLTEQDYQNKKMETAITLINIFFEKIEFNNVSKTIDGFTSYIFENLTFFISELPTGTNGYNPQDLNKYFEGMNATGRGLENHEILKVELLKKIGDGISKENYTKIWNAVSQMDKPLVRQRKDKENESQFQERYKKATALAIKPENIFDGEKGKCTINDLYKVEGENNVKTGEDTIRKIDSPNQKPSNQKYSEGQRAILSFPEFLLQVLWLQLSEEKRKTTNDFFNVHKLQETFKNLEDKDVQLFFDNLLKYRILFDYYVIRISENDAGSSSYLLEMKDDETNLESKNKLIQYQSMLYVSTTSHIWLTPLLSELVTNQKNAEELLSFLKNVDNNRRKYTTELKLSYGSIDRYWFWRLDYYLWEQEQAKTGKKEAITKYIFRANRSIEHLHPQTDDQFPIKWDKEQKDNFGNLAMISSSFNSTQSNESIQVKFARVSEQIEKVKLESIKLYEMYKIAEKDDKKWTIDLANKHGDEMIDILIKSFCPNYKNDCNIDCKDNCYFGICKALEIEKNKHP